MSSIRGLSSSKSGFVGPSIFEPLEGRQLFAVARPDHVVIVIEQDRASDAIGNPIWAYLNQIASTGLVYSNSHGVGHPSELNSVAIYSGSTQDVDDNGRHHLFDGPNLAKALFDAGLSFGGYVENLPEDGSQVAEAGDGVYPDLYTRNLNPMAQFTDIGIDPATGLPRDNSVVNRTFGVFSSIPTGDYSSLPTVSFIIPNTLHSSHGSNEMEPWAGSPDEENNDILRSAADNWLKNNMDAYLQWAKQNNSLLIVTQDEERSTGGNSPTITTVINGDADLFNPGVNSDNINHYNLLRTITEMYGLMPLGDTGAVLPFDADGSGQLIPDGPVVTGTSTALSSNFGTTSFGASVIFTAKVTAEGGSLIPGGAVTFMDGSTVIGTGNLNAQGVATLTISSLAVGSHSISAMYNGNASFAGSTSNSLTQTVNPLATSTTLSASVGSTTVGQSVTFTASTNGKGGSVTFKDGNTVLATVNIDAFGKAKLTTSSLSASTHSITAVYSGSATHTGSTSAALTYVVNKASSIVSVTSAPNPSQPGQAVTMTATVQSSLSLAGTPTGTVQFQINGVNFGAPVPLVNGKAVSAPNSSLSEGSYAITAIYSGSDKHTGGASTALTQAVVIGPPANNSFSKRIRVSGAITSAFGKNVAATRELFEPSHAGGDGKSVWWTWTAPSSGVVTINTLGSAFDTTLGVYTGSSLLLLSRVAENDDAAVGVKHSSVTFNAVAGRIYQIAVDGAGGQSGDIALRIFTHAKVPTNVKASDGTYTDKVRVTWSAATGAQAYEVWRGATSTASAATKISVGDVAGTSFDDTTATPGVKYWYFVKAKNAVSSSALSAANQGYRAVAPAITSSLMSTNATLGDGLNPDDLLSPKL